MFFWNSLAFSMIQQTLAIWSLVPLPFLNPAYTSGSFSVQVLLKPCLKDFEHYLASMWNEHKWYYEYSLALPVWGIGMKTNTFQSCGHCWVFQICWHNEWNTLTALFLGILNSSAGIQTPPLSLFIILPEDHLTSHSRTSGFRQRPHHCGYLVH